MMQTGQMLPRSARRAETRPARIRPGRLRFVAGFVFAMACACVALPVLAAGDAAPETERSAGARAVVPEPDGYRMDDYRAPVPATLSGATVVDTAEAGRLHDDGVPFVDVLPRVPRPKNLPKGTLWRPEPRQDIPGSIWLVDTGYGELAPIMERYLFDGIERITAGDKAARILFYCKRDCWMSYNAAKRAVGAGYTSVYWYPDGTDGWSEADRPLEKREPEPRPDE